MSSRQAAPLVHARTAYIDFRPDFISAPADLQGEARERIRKKDVASLDYAERLDEGPRWVLFRESDHLVAGVAAMATWFSDDLTREIGSGPDGAPRPDRNLYAFVGAVYPMRGGEACAPTQAQAFYRDIYEEIVGPRFFERQINAGWQSPTQSQYRDVPVSPIESQGMPVPDRDMIQAFPLHEGERLWHRVASGRGAAALCTRVPAGRHLQHRLFDIITQAGIENMQSLARVAARDPGSGRTASRLRVSDPASDPRAFDEAQKKKSSWGWAGFGLHAGDRHRSAGDLRARVSQPLESERSSEPDWPIRHEPALWAKGLLLCLAFDDADAERLSLAPDPLKWLKLLAKSEGRGAQLVKYSRTEKHAAKLAGHIEDGATLVLGIEALLAQVSGLAYSRFLTVVAAPRAVDGAGVELYGDAGGKVCTGMQRFLQAIRDDATILILSPPAIQV